MLSFATPVSTLAALALPLAVAAQGYPVMADPMAPGVPPGGVIGAPAMGVPAMGAPAVGAPAVGAPAVGAPLVGAPVGGAPYGGGAVVVSPGQQLQGGYIITPQNSWGTGVVTPGNPPTYIVPNNAGGTAIVTPGYGSTLVRPNPDRAWQLGDRRARRNGLRGADAAGRLHPATGIRAAGGHLSPLKLSRLRRAAPSRSG
jgi:hypothetical protein